MGNAPAFFRMYPSKFRAGSAVLVQGATGGLGKEITKIYAGRGCPMVITGRNEDVLKALQKECHDYFSNYNVHYIVADCTTEKECQRVVDFMIEKCKRIDILVLAAGVAAHVKFGDLPSIDLVKKIMDTNFFSYVNLTRCALPHLRHNNGQIAVVNSISGLIPIPYRAAYCASKYAVTGFFDTLQYEEAENITVSQFCPNSFNGSGFRKNSLTGPLPEKNDPKVVPVDEAALLFVAAVDRRIKKLIVPWQGYVTAYIH